MESLGTTTSRDSYTAYTLILLPSYSPTWASLWPNGTGSPLASQEVHLQRPTSWDQEQDRQGREHIWAAEQGRKWEQRTISQENKSFLLKSEVREMVSSSWS